MDTWGDLREGYGALQEREEGELYQPSVSGGCLEDEGNDLSKEQQVL